MRLTPWIMPFVFAAAMLSVASLASADEHEHEPLDDQALEEKYGIKEGAVKRDDEDRNSESDTSESDTTGTDNQAEEEKQNEVGTGGPRGKEADVEESEQGADDD